MPETPITFIKGDTIGIETDYRDSLPVNMTAIQRPIMGAMGYMLQAPGLTSISSFPEDDPCRGAVWNERQEIQYRAWSSDTSGVLREADYIIDINNKPAIDFTIIGSWTGANADRPISMPYSFESQGIVAVDNFFLWLPATTTFLTGGVDMDPLFVGTIDAVWIRGYYFLTDGDTLYHTLLTDETVVEASESTAQLSPDPILGLGLTQDDKVIVFGRYTVEYFAVIAREGFTFQNLPNRAFKSGLVATHAKVEILGDWFYVGGRKAEGVGVHVIQGISPSRVSSREIEKLLGTYSELELADMNCESREEDGVSYLIVHLPNQTLQLNLNILKELGPDNAWSILSTGTEGDTWRANFGMFDNTFGEWIYGDNLDGRVGKLDSTVATQYDQIAEWLLYTPIMFLDSVSIDEIEIEVIPGHTDFDDAKVFMSLNQDGVTGGTEFILEYGRGFEYDHRFISRRHGYVRNWVTITMRGASRSRMAFGKGRMKYG